MFRFNRTHCCSKVTYVVLVNFGEKEEHVDVTELTQNLGEICEVTVAGPHSHFSEGWAILIKKKNQIINFFHS